MAVNQWPISNMQDLIIASGVSMVGIFGKTDYKRTIVFYPNGVVENGSMHLEYWSTPDSKIEPYSILQIGSQFYNFGIGNEITFKQLIRFSRDRCIDLVVTSDSLKREDTMPDVGTALVNTQY